MAIIYLSLMRVSTFTTIIAMLKIQIFSTGKNKEDWLKQGVDVYTSRLKGKMSIQWALYKTGQELENALFKLPHFICLDVGAPLISSEEFSQLLYRKSLSCFNFAIGDAEGFSEEIKGKAAQKISLSRLTFTHQMVRIILLEQLYRAYEIFKGSNYHK